MQTEVADVQDSAARAAASELELKSFSYIVSHDIAASLRHVTEFSRLLMDGLSEDLTPIQHEHASHVRRAADRCQLMMEQLLVFSRVQDSAPRRILDDAGATLDLSLSTVRSLPEAVGAEFDITPLGQVFADPELISIAFEHLLHNAVKFVRPGEQSRVKVEPAHDEATFRIRISDTGIGVPQAYREKAFRMFQRLNTESAYPGVGAGLAISRRIARLHGGEVALIDCDAGACVELSLPRALVSNRDIRPRR